MKVFKKIKAFQLTLQHNQTLCKPGIMDAILQILLKVTNFLQSETGPQASQILAESLSSRCTDFHFQLKQYVTNLKSNTRAVGLERYASTPEFKVDMLCALFKTLLEVLPDSSWSCLPVDELLDATRHLSLTSTPSIRFVTKAEEIVALRDQIQQQFLEKQRTAARKTSIQEWDNTEYRQIPILPRLEEVCISGAPAKLRPNIVDGPYTDWMHYYDIQFRLLREDFIAPLRRGVCEYMQGVRGRKLKDVKVYRDVTIIEPVFTRSGICYSLHFDLPSHMQWYNWEHSKRLMFGSLVCLSPDDFQTVIFATIANRDPKKLAKGKIEVQFQEGARILPYCQKTTFTMVESLAYFEASRHILRSLQTAEVDTMPFTRYLIHDQCGSVSPPQYLNREGSALYDLNRLYGAKKSPEGSVLYDLNCLYGAKKSPLARNLNFINVLDMTQWPSKDEIELDQSQLDAIQMALTQEIAVIQGPPGTGKTYIGLRIVEALLRNRNVWDPEQESPIVVMCFTNHALDQFLEGILKQTSLQIETDSYSDSDSEEEDFLQEPKSRRTKIIRIGGRSQSELIQQFNIKKKRRDVYLPGRVLQEIQELEDQVKRSTGNVLWQQLQQSTHSFLPLWELQPVIDPEHLYQLLHHTKSATEKKYALLIWLGLCDVVYQLPDAKESDMAAGIQQNPVDGAHASSQANQSQTDGSDIVAHAFANLQQQEETVREYFYQYDSNMHPVISTLQEQPPESEESTGKSEIESEGDEELIDIQGEAAAEVAARILDDEFEHFNPVFKSAASANEIAKHSMTVQDTDFGWEDPFTIDRTDNTAEATNQPTDTQPICIVKQAQKSDEILHWGRSQPRMTKAEADTVDDIHHLSLIDRWRLYNFWAAKHLKQLIDKNETEFQTHNRLCRRYNESSHQADRFALETADVIGMTTTGAAKYQHILHLVKPKIVIVEEAAEVLESHIVSTLNAGSQHLILIGDHKQLRPKPNEYDLAKKYKLDISLLERLVHKGFPHATLQIQHRMRPVIAELVCPHIYDTLINHESVLHYGDVKGICKNLFFIHHEFHETEDEGFLSHSNPHEANYIPGLCKYLLQQGYEPSQITVLVTYTGQQMMMRKQMPKEDFDGIGVTTVDNYQGEENDIILLSLVRSNEEGNIGFLREANRVCVALSRAKMGFYCIGNFKMLREKGVIWERIMSDMEKKGCLGEALPLYCCNHPDTKSMAKSHEDFAKNALCGGCTRDCEFRLDCGHVCAQKCHIKDSKHEEYECKKLCTEVCSEGHPCLLLCHIGCRPCEVQVERLMPECGHMQKMYCHEQPSDVLCENLCSKKCPSGHPCPLLCYDGCRPCEVQVERLMPKCGHMQKMYCHEQPSAVVCKNPCSKKCPNGHPCPLLCYRGCVPCTVEVLKIIPGCGHEQLIPCYHNPSYYDCMADCPKKCANGHPCSKRCYEPCGSCTIDVKKTLPECGHTIVLPCFKEPRPELCNERCEKTRPCGHRCTRKCGETCKKYPCSANVQVPLDCGHTKKVECYLSSHLNLTALLCQKPCEKKLPCTHTCQNKCCEPCAEQCNAVVNKVWPCGHKLKRKCYQAQNPEVYPCQKACERKLQCGHPCTNKCGQTCIEKCVVPVERKYPCGHTNKVSCSSTPRDRPCGSSCSTKLSCGHECEGKCSNCYKLRIHSLCKYGLKLRHFCGHTFPVDCLKLEDTHPGKMPCTASCTHNRCSHNCSTDCPPCIEPCQWVCPHYQCSKLCHEMCDRPPCNERCINRLTCGHQCVGICGEPCPTICPECKSQDFSKMLRHAKKFQKDQFYVQLSCGHIFTVEFMDTFIQQKPIQGTLVGPKKCPDPKCGLWINSSFRYGNAIKLSLKDVEAVRKIVQTEQQKYHVQVPEVLVLQMHFNEPSITNHIQQMSVELSSRSNAKSLKEAGWITTRTHRLTADTYYRYQLYPPITATLLQIKEMLAKENPTLNVEQKCLIEFLITALNFLNIVHVHGVRDVSEELGEGVDNIHKQVINFIKCLIVLMGKAVKSRLSAQLLEDLESEQYRLALLLQFTAAQYEPEESPIAVTMEHTKKLLQALEVDRSCRMTREVYNTQSRGLPLAVDVKISDLLVKDFPPLVKGQWYKCIKGHYYCTPPAREATPVPKCPKC